MLPLEETGERAQGTSVLFFTTSCEYIKSQNESLIFSKNHWIGTDDVRL